MEAVCVGFDVPPAEGGFAAQADRALHHPQPSPAQPPEAWQTLAERLSREQGEKVLPPAGPAQS